MKHQWSIIFTLCSSITSVVYADFTDVTASAGVEFDNDGAVTFMPYAGGVVWADFNGDGLDDIYAPRTSACNNLYLNLGNSTFYPAAGHGAELCSSTSLGATAADYDNDGDQDLYVTTGGQNHLLRNYGDATFVDITASADMDNDGMYNSSSAVWGDFNADGNLDLFVGNHATQMSPAICAPDLLYLNQGDGSFNEVAGALGISPNTGTGLNGCTLAATWSDYDGDGDLDLLVVNDFGAEVMSNRLYRNDGQGGFEDVSASSGFDYEMYGMGIAIGDIDLDGDRDYYMSDIGANNFALNDGAGSFVDAAASAGVKADEQATYGGQGMVSWGAVFFDADHDGLEDLFVANGGSPEGLWPGMFGADYVDENPVYAYVNQGSPAPFTETHLAQGLGASGYHRSVASADYDGDGDRDLFVGVHHGNNVLYRNNTDGALPWFKVKARGTIGNRDALGATVRILGDDALVQKREIDGGSSFLSMNTKTAHFGLGSAATRIESATVTFLGGVAFEGRRLAMNQTVEVLEPEIIVVPDSPAVVVNVSRTFTVEWTITNRTNETVTFDAWLDATLPDESSVEFRSSASMTYGPMESNIYSLVITAPNTPGDYELIGRLGTYPSDIVHQSFVDVTVKRRSGWW